MVNERSSKLIRFRLRKKGYLESRKKILIKRVAKMVPSDLYATLSEERTDRGQPRGEFHGSPDSR